LTAMNAEVMTECVRRASLMIAPTIVTTRHSHMSLLLKMWGRSHKSM
jgi:hypothetical protein